MHSVNNNAEKYKTLQRSLGVTTYLSPILIHIATDIIIISVIIFSHSDKRNKSELA